MASSAPVTLSDGHVQLEAKAADAGSFAWKVSRLSDHCALGTVGLEIAVQESGIARGSLTIETGSTTGTSEIHAMAKAVRLACQWSFASADLVVITWRGATDPTTRAIVNEAGFTVHPLPARAALDGPDGPQNAWYADLTASDTRAASHQPLTAREHHVLAAMARGGSNAEIARDLGISENTVKNHVRSILEVLQAPSRTAAVVFALRSGVVSLDDPAP